MRTILFRNSETFRFNLSDPTPRSEEDFERTVIQVLRELYPDCRVVPFKPLIECDAEGWRPDLALVEKGFAYWFVIEVELATHSLQKHVIPQVRAFRLGEYGQEVWNALADGLGISVDQAATITRYVPRYIAVVSNQEDDHWLKTLASQNTQLVTISEYDGGYLNKSALLVNGSLIAAEQSLGFGTVYATQQIIRTPVNPFWKPGEYRIMEPEGMAAWSCVIEKDGVWLAKKKGLIRLDDRSIVQILRRGDSIEFRPLTV